MKIVVIGLGSMGKRRIRLLNQYIQKECSHSVDSWKIVGVDSSEKRRDETRNSFLIDVYSELSEALTHAELDCAIISTSPQSHEALIQTCLNHNLHVFTELNLLSEGYDENIHLAEKKNKTLCLSSTFLYRKEIQFIKRKIKNQPFKGAYRYHISQYLPEWHPWENYKDFFISEKKTNACREIFAIELPWIIDIFGDVCSINVMHKKVSELEIHFDDTYQVLLEHQSGVLGNLTVDVVSPKTGRVLEIWGEGFHLEWSGTPDTLKCFNSETKENETINLYDNVEHIEGYSHFVIENAYYDELINFIGIIQGKDVSKYSFQQDKKILSLIDRIEE